MVKECCPSHGSQEEGWGVPQSFLRPCVLIIFPVTVTKCSVNERNTSSFWLAVRFSLCCGSSHRFGLMVSQGTLVEAPLKLEPRGRPYPLFSLKMWHTSCRRGPGAREIGSMARLKGKRDYSGHTWSPLGPVMYRVLLPPFPDGGTEAESINYRVRATKSRSRV